MLMILSFFFLRTVKNRCLIIFALFKLCLPTVLFSHESHYEGLLLTLEQRSRKFVRRVSTLKSQLTDANLFHFINGFVKYVRMLVSLQATLNNVS